MLDAIARRLAQAAATLLLASALVWSLVLLAPGDPARRVLAANNVINPQPLQVQAERRLLGLNGSALHRYLRWLGGAWHGDLGRSWATGRPVAHELLRRLPATLVLTSAALALSVLLALGLGLLAASAPGRWPDTLARVISLTWLVTPAFLLGTVLLDVVVVRWHHFEVVADGHWDSVLLPALTLSLSSAAAWSRILRASLIEAEGATHNEVARARGVGRSRRLLVHSLPNAVVPFLTVMGTGVAALLGGAPIVETVFSWPGIGAYAVNAITARDVPVIQSFTLFAVLAFVIASVSVDVLAAAIDPRLRTVPLRRWRRGGGGRSRPLRATG
jgi:ABC-type dipeptide/oligopeptide/nickel transport system permease component